MTGPAITEQEFEEWMSSRVTLRLFKMLRQEREDMKEGLVSDSYEQPELVKGRCQALGLLLELEYRDILEPGEIKNATVES